MRSVNNPSGAELQSAESGLESAPLRVAIIGAGAIGCYLGTMLAQYSSFDVIFVGRERVALEAAAHGFTAQDLDGSPHHLSASLYKF